MQACVAADVVPTIGIIELGRFQLFLKLLRQAAELEIDVAGDVAEGDGAIGAAHRDAAGGNLEIAGCGFQHVGRGIGDLLTYRTGGQSRGAAGQHGAAAGISAGAVGAQ